MSNLQLIELLCQIAEQQISIIRELASALAQERSLTAEEKERVENAVIRYSNIIGADELPDEF